MPLPNISSYGIIDNPIIINPYFDNNDIPSEQPIQNSFFVELAGPNITVLAGGNFLLLGPVV